MESAQDRADYPRYLLRLCELERIDRERRNVERRMDPALVDFDFAKASAILTDMVASYLAAGAPPFNPEGSDDNEFEDRRSTRQACIYNIVLALWFTWITVSCFAAGRYVAGRRDFRTDEG
jgi:uncharacterized membrane protein YgcG